MPLILCLETATKLCSVALARDGEVVAVSELEQVGHVHAEKLNVFIDEVMAKAGLDLAELDAVAVGIGPGSYTGLRIGLSAAKGLCYALERPIIGISTLATLVESAKLAGLQAGVECWPMVDARRMEVFTCPFSATGATEQAPAPMILDAQWAAGDTARAVFGDGADKAAGLWAAAPHITHVAGVRPSATAMAPIAARRYAAGAFDDLAYLVPEYGKAANVTRSGPSKA